MSMFRSETMGYYQLVMPRETAWEVMNALGQMESVHIIESKSMQKPFNQQVKRCEESLLKISNFEQTLKQHNITLHKVERYDYQYQELFVHWTQKAAENKRHAISLLDEVDREIETQWNYYIDLNKRIEAAKALLINKEYNLAVLRSSQKILGRNFYEARRRKSDLHQPGAWIAGNVSHKCGIINKQQQSRFQRTIFRISRGNAYTSFVPIKEVYTSQFQEISEKSVFFILYPSRSDGEYLGKKIERLMEISATGTFELPDAQESLLRQTADLEKGIAEYRSLLALLQQQKTNFLNKLVDEAMPNTPFTRIEYQKIFMIKEREIYHQLNQMDLFNNFIQGRIYIPEKDFEAICTLFKRLERKDAPTAHLAKLTTNKYPTMFQINPFTGSAQEIVDTYGVPRYKEANPGLFTCVTFPFLFGVMFGDMMHGAILLAFGLMLMFKKQQYDRTFLKLLTPHRYLVALMGFFSFYCGFIYNDYMSISLNLFGSCYEPKLAQGGQEIPRKADCVYPFGLDPVWSISSNGLTYVNSMKMKIAVIIGVVHMSWGVCLKAFNSIYFKKWIDLIFEFFPQITFMILLFGYMDFLIIYKWTVDWGLYSAEAPSIITTMINLPLGLGQTQDCCGAQPMWGTYGSTSQDRIQLIFLVVSLLCIPLMLLPKPLYEIYCHKKKKPVSSIPNAEESPLLMRSSDNLAKSLSTQSVEEEEQHSSDEVFVHQMIETIEYVLGCISNTASYLRLWALSLAHSQLADVFFQKTVEEPIVEGYAGIPGDIIGFVVLSSATFGVLLCMDTMECFLHALRLHWVEFQNKFYKADGFPFVSYSFVSQVRKASEQ